MIGALGRISRSIDDHRDIKFASVIDHTPTYSAPPFVRDWTNLNQYEWLVNDRLGCCTITGIAHLIQNLALSNGREVRFTDAEIIDAYSKVTRYVKGDPSTDRGGLMINALTHARRVGIGGHKIGAFVRINHNDFFEVRAAINMFGGLYVGARLPRRIREQDIFKIPTQRESQDSPGSLGGHAFAVFGYDRNHFRTLMWRDPKLAEISWFDFYVDEAWAVIDEAWINDGITPSGFRADRLKNALAALG